MNNEHQLLITFIKQYLARRLLGIGNNFLFVQLYFDKIDLKIIVWWVVRQN